MTLPLFPSSVEITPRAVLLPGSGSDADFVERAFGTALSARGIELIAVAPEPRSVVAGYLEALDDAAREPGALLVGGVSLGAAIATRWALRQHNRLSGMLIGLPAWLGLPADAPASLSATYSAAQLRLRGLPAVLHDIHSSAPPWLAAELSRAWERQWPALPQAFEEAARAPGPTEAELTMLPVPTGVVGAVDDPVHPIEVAQLWARACPSAHLATIALAELGADPAVLGDRCLRSWTAACTQSAIR